MLARHSVVTGEASGAYTRTLVPAAVAASYKGPGTSLSDPRLAVVNDTATMGSDGGPCGDNADVEAAWARLLDPDRHPGYLPSGLESGYGWDRGGMVVGDWVVFLALAHQPGQHKVRWPQDIVLGGSHHGLRGPTPGAPPPAHGM